MKILVLGDSHAAAVKYGWDTIAKAHPDKTVDFFALPRLRMNTLKATKKRIMMAPRARAGDIKRFADVFPDGEVEAAAYDAIFLVGFLETGHSLIAANQHTRLPGQMSARRGGLLGLARKQPATHGTQAIGTKAMFAAAWDSIFEASVARSMLKQMNKLRHPPCYWAINPMVSQQALTPGHPLRGAFKEVIARRDAQVFLDLARAGTAAKLPPHVTMLAQPAQTIHDGCMTKTKFMTGARAFYEQSKGFGKRDVLHANADYGVLLLQDLFARVSQHRTAEEARL